MNDKRGLYLVLNLFGWKSQERTSHPTIPGSLQRSSAAERSLPASRGPGVFVRDGRPIVPLAPGVARTVVHVTLNAVVRT